MKSPVFTTRRTCAGIPVRTTLRGAPANFLVDVRYCSGAVAEVCTDQAARAVDWAYLADRIRRVAAARHHETEEALAEELSRLVFADIRTDEVEVTLRRVLRRDDAEIRTETSLTRSRDEAPLGPVAPAGHFRRAHRMQFAGSLVKTFARPFHALFPSKRWTIPAVDPARHPPRSESPIPRILWQTNFTDKCSLPMWANYRRNRRLSDDFEHRLFGNDECAAYVHAHASPRVAAAYDRLSDGAARADLWRLVVLFEEGGVYMDVDGSLVRPLSDIVAGRSHVWLWDRKRFSNYFLASVPRNPVVAKFIDCVVDHIEHHAERKQRSVFYVTGPGALEEVLDACEDVDYVPRQSIALQGMFTNERYQYIDRPRSKWIYKKTFLK